MMEKFYKKVHIKGQNNKKDILVIFILLQETKNSNLFDKNYTQEYVKCHNSPWRKLAYRKSGTLSYDPEVGP